MTKNWFGMTGTPTSTFFSCSPSMPSPSSCWWWSTSRGKGRATAMRTTMPSSWRESGKNRLLEDDLGRGRTWYPKNRTKEVLVVHSLKVIQWEKPICLPVTIVRLYHTDKNLSSYFTSSSFLDVFFSLPSPVIYFWSFQVHRQVIVWLYWKENRAQTS